MLISKGGQKEKKGTCVHCFQHYNMYVQASDLNPKLILFFLFFYVNLIFRSELAKWPGYLTELLNLQILGPESGWQAVSLTEIITSSAVKKAYRKATLCVHPDKLQQRGATIHQKYICEKVFDLLKVLESDPVFYILL